MRIPLPMRLLASTSLLLLSALALAQSGVPGGGGALPRLAEFHFDQRDYKGNLTTTDSSIAPNSHPAIEWNRAPGFETDVTHIAYVKGSAATLDIRLTNQRPHPVSGSFNFTSARLKVPGPSTVDPGPYYLPLSITCPNSSFLLQSNTSIVLTATINGLPNHVAVGGLQVKYDLPLIDNPGPNQPGPCDNGTTGNWVDWERICVLDATPVGYLVDDQDQATEAPWEHGIWTDFLEYTCRWAYGASGPAEVRRELTKGIHYGKYAPWNRLHYLPINGQYWGVSKFGDGQDFFSLNMLMNDLGSPVDNNLGSSIWVLGNCSDFGGILQLSLSSHGVTAECVIVKTPGVWVEPSDPNEPPYLDTGYWYWPLCKAGSDSTITSPMGSIIGGSYGTKKGNYEAGGFDYHVIVESSGMRYDAAASYYFSSNGSTWLNPAYDWPEDDYWQSLPSPFFGHAFSRSCLFNFTYVPLGLGSELLLHFPVKELRPTNLLGDPQP